MSQAIQQVIKPTFVDDPTVHETFVNGPVNLSMNGQIAVLTFTVVRGDFEQSMEGHPVTKATATAAIRLAMPLNNLVDLKHFLSNKIQEQPIPTPTTTKQ